jgi:hypothetical protein
VRVTECGPRAWHRQWRAPVPSAAAAAWFRVPRPRRTPRRSIATNRSEADLSGSCPRRTAARSLGVDTDRLTPWRGKPLGDLYTDVVCGAVPLDVTSVGRIETVPLAHQSALAGILMAAELVKRTNPQLSAMSQVEPLISWDDILRPPPSIWTKPRSREPGCICGDPDYLESYREKWS